MSERESSYREKIEAKRNEMVNTMLDFIQNNSADWERGWYKPALEIPANGSTGKPYRGINMLYLLMISAKKGYTDNRWVTFNQAKELGAHVKQGEKSREIFYWSQYDKKTKKPFDERTVGVMTEEEKHEYMEENVRPVLKFYQVFNAEQCTNFPERANVELTPEMAAEERAHQNALIERVISNSAAPITYGGSRAYYSPSLDEIHLPKIEDFKTMQDYYATALHEIAHSTGHESRLNRNLQGSFERQEYAQEELRAELASVFMQTELGISIDGHHFENHGAYLSSWLKAVREDTKEFFAAARDAEKISDYVVEHYLQAEQSSENKVEQAREQVLNGIQQVQTAVQDALKSAQDRHEEGSKEKAPIFERNLPFADQVDAVLSGADTTNTHLEVLHTTPQILQDVGLPDLPILMTAKHLKSATHDSGADTMNYHALGSDMVKQLPELLSDPVMIMDSLTREDSIVVVTESHDKENRPVIGAIKVNGKGYINQVEISANILTSMYGKDNFRSFIERNVNAGNILFYNKEKSQELFKIPGIQFPNNLDNLDFNIIIRKSRAFVKHSAEKKSENFSNSFESGSPEEEKPMTGARFQAGARAVEQEPVKDDRSAKSLQKDLFYKEWFNNELLKEERGEDSRWTNNPDKAYQYFSEMYDNELLESRFLPSKERKEYLGVDTSETSQKPNLGASRAREWLSLEIPAELIGAEGEGKSRMIKLPQGEYSHFVLFVPKAWLKPGEKEGSMTLSVNANSEYVIRNDGREVKLNGSELRAAFEGKEVGKSAQRTAPSRRTVQAMDLIEANVPNEMKSLSNWCVFHTKWNEEKGKKDKTIISPIDGKWAKSNDPSKWTDFESAKQYALEHGAEGLAFALDFASGISCIDLDKCIDKEGNLTETAQKLTGEYEGTYIETSTSGNGVHIFVKDDILAGGKYKNRVEVADGEIEVYESGRFISMTGNVRTNVRTLGQSPQTTKAWLRRTLGERAPQQTFTPNVNVEGSDQEIIDRIRKSRKGSEFDALMSGENLANDHSRSDYRLLNMLAFFSDGNQDQMARIFRTSGLYRPEKGEPYLQRSVEAACKGLTSRYGQGQGSFKNQTKGSSSSKGR